MQPRDLPAHVTGASLPQARARRSRPRAARASRCSSRGWTAARPSTSRAPRWPPRLAARGAWCRWGRAAGAVTFAAGGCGARCDAVMHWMALSHLLDHTLCVCAQLNMVWQCGIHPHTGAPALHGGGRRGERAARHCVRGVQPRRYARPHWPCAHLSAGAVLLHGAIPMPPQKCATRTR